MAGVEGSVRRLDPPRPVLVRHDDGRWYTGRCDGWIRQDDGTWKASVTYTVTPGAKYLRSLAADRVTPVQE